MHCDIFFYTKRVSMCFIDYNKLHSVTFTKAKISFKVTKVEFPLLLFSVYSAPYAWSATTVALGVNRDCNRLWSQRHQSTSAATIDLSDNESR